ncbi:hypothetical protein [Acinetobacter sp. MD2]|uniref:hypothetical protein n=1 Tax=Acinetobacter sp. MD2 TaxID=2600066 RepID=UPI002D1E9A70|nr:hypothetical protein [Acinetobacter sp. MD2]MEB3767307.1 hypothetical protein [Acinetobacter sp. MD2]
MQQLQPFLKDEISLDDLDLEQLIAQVQQLPEPDSEAYRMLELTLNQALTQYLDRAKKYINK